MIRRLTISLLVTLISACGNLSLFNAASLPEQAESLANEGNTSEAIAVYRQHLERRLSITNRPDWENPYLYLLAIGDLELKQGNVQQALNNYEEAEKQSVGKELISDRFRGVALYFEEQGKLEEACEILKKYRDRDTLLFDGMLDRMSKEIVAREEASRNLTGN